MSKPLQLVACLRKLVFSFTFLYAQVCHTAVRVQQNAGKTAKRHRKPCSLCGLPVEDLLLTIFLVSTPSSLQYLFRRNIEKNRRAT